jgi:hypothetical protein
MKNPIFTFFTAVMAITLIVVAAQVIGLMSMRLNAGLFQVYPSWFTDNLHFLAAVLICGWVLNPVRQFAEPFAFGMVVIFPSFMNFMTEGEVVNNAVRYPHQGDWFALACVGAAGAYFVGALIARLLKIKRSRSVPPSGFGEGESSFT